MHRWSKQQTDEGNKDCRQNECLKSKRHIARDEPQQLEHPGHKRPYDESDEHGPQYNDPECHLSAAGSGR